LTSPKAVPFGKYESSGAYHWTECDRRSSFFNPPLRARYDAVVGRIASAKQVLDVGCGDGYLMSLISPRAERVVGVDAELRGVQLATAQLDGFANCRVAGADSYALPFRSGSFDVVVLADVIEHLEHPELCLAEIRRVLAPGGAAFVTTPVGRPGQAPGWNHVKEYSGAELTDLLRRHFGAVSLVYLWPRAWSRLYSTAIGWRAIKLVCRLVNVNPFRREGSDPEAYEQVLAICR
jgi:SAM-dependent methyltransferase